MDIPYLIMDDDLYALSSRELKGVANTVGNFNERCCAETFPASLRIGKDIKTVDGTESLLSLLRIRLNGSRDDKVKIL